MDDIRERLRAVSRNLWSSWQPEVDTIFRSIDAKLWRQVNHNPVAFLADVDEGVLQDSGALVLAQLGRVERRLREYLAQDLTPSDLHALGWHASPVAYFSAEFCVHECLPIYSGGLGVLAGDHLKSCSDLGIPAVGVSLLYRSGYFRQQIDADGRQVEVYQELDTDRVPIERVVDENGQTRRVEVPVGDGSISADIWQAPVGRCILYLLDVSESTLAEVPQVQRLYGGDGATRLVQEIVLGSGGYRVFEAIGTKPAVIHLNEGHCSFAALEAIASNMEQTGASFEDAVADVMESIVFTTHTPVPAGHDRFAPDDVLSALAPLRQRLGLSESELLGLGRVDPSNDDETFCMTVLSLKLSRRATGVSSLHGGVSRMMWRDLWPERRVSEVPIGHVTNGVHVGSWLASELHQLYAEILGTHWRQEMADPALWSQIGNLDESDLWAIKLALKQRLFEFIDRRHKARCERLDLDAPPPRLSVDALTIGFARRAAEYKRLMLLLDDIENTRPLLTDPQRPIQIVFAGKSHPADELGKGLLRRLIEISEQPELRNHIVFIEDYDRNVARHVLEGCDLWLNTPRRPYEACGTSGMKAVFNAALNCSTLDGWWDEAYDGRNGFAFGGGRQHSDPKVLDAADRASLVDVLSRQVVPLFYDRDTEGVPVAWLRRVKHALYSLGWRYNSHRMVTDYTKHLYLPAARSLTAEIRD